MAGNKPLAGGFSPDGYIIDQDCFSSVRYRTLPASLNGCGWIAAYNLRHFLGHDAPYDTVRQEMERLHFSHMPGPTLMCVMRKYLRLYVPQYREAVGRDEALAAAGASCAGIFRYREGCEPHFISYVRQADGLFRFFNVADGLEDCRMSMDQFVGEHCARGVVIALTVE